MRKISNVVWWITYAQQLPYVKGLSVPDIEESLANNAQEQNQWVYKGGHLSFPYDVLIILSIPVQNRQ